MNNVIDLFDFPEDTTKIDEIGQIVKKLEESNLAYRETGNPILTDAEYDELKEQLERLDPLNSFLKKVYHTVKDTKRKEKLPINLVSMNKCKTVEELQKWCKLKGIPINSVSFIITPKFDGLTLLRDLTLNKAWKGGDEGFGENCTQHLNSILSKYNPVDIDKLKKELDVNSLFIIGEGIFTIEDFEKEISIKAGYKNARNGVSGLLNADYDSKNDEIFNLCYYQQYTLLSNEKEWDKEIQLKILNKYFNQKFPVLFEKCTYQQIQDYNYLKKLYYKWKECFEIDGLIIEVNESNIRKRIGTETSTQNPGYARAFKSSEFEQEKNSQVIRLIWEISKQGHNIPVAEIEPISLNGVTVSRVTLNNANQVEEMKINSGAIVTVKRSGQVIPFISNVIKKATPKLPTHCPSCNTELIWDKNHVHLKCTNENCRDKQIKKIIAFFSILKTEGVSEATCELLYNYGYDTIQKILNMKQEDFMKLPKVAETKSSNLYKSIKNSVSNLSLSTLQYASGIFTQLGDKKLKLLEHFKIKPTIDEVKKIEGFSDVLAANYVENYDVFFEWMKTLSITIKEPPKINVLSDKYKGRVFCFTMIRDKELEQYIISHNGKINDGVNKQTTDLICRLTGEGSGKELKAEKLGIKIWSINEFKQTI